MKKYVVSLFIDNYDSYSYNIVHFLYKVNNIEPIVIKPDEINFDEFMKNYYGKIDNIILSPGYGNPETDTKNSLVIEILKKKMDIPILGICYGHQLICYFYGCNIKKVKNMFHGNTNIINICQYENETSELFTNIKDKFKAVCYNSLKVSKPISDVLNITCYSIYLNEYIVMGTRHKYLPYHTVQYHPESIESDFSLVFFENFKNFTLRYNKCKKISFNMLEHKLCESFIRNVEKEKKNNFKWKLNILKVSGVDNLDALSYKIFENVFYDDNTISYWLDSNNEILYRYKKKEKYNYNKEGNIKDQSYENLCFDQEILNNTRFSYMGNTEGFLSEVIEYYLEDNNNITSNSLIVNLRKNQEKYEVNYINEEHNCLVLHLKERIGYFKNNFIIDYAHINIHEYVVDNEKKFEKSTFHISDKYNDRINFDSDPLFLEFNKDTKKEFLLNYYKRMYNLSKCEIEDDEFLNNKNSCLLGYVGFLNYEYKYETIKYLYNKKCKTVKNEQIFPISVFIFSQNFLAIDLIKNNIYIISLEPEQLSLHNYISSLNSSSNKNEQNNSSGHLKKNFINSFEYKVSDLKTYNEIKEHNIYYKYTTLHKIIEIMKNSIKEKEEHIKYKKEKIKINENFPYQLNKNNNKIIFSSLINKEKYIENVSKCKTYIENGDSYELCLTTKFNGCYHDIPINFLDLYKYMRSINKVSYSCYIHYNRNLCINNDICENFLKMKVEQMQFIIMCFSPEEFLRKDKEKIIFSKPIKGTIKRGKNEEEDIKLKNELLNNKKERSENLMIVDLTTNDFNRICEMDTVKVSKLFHIETYTFLHQMVSQITGKIKKNKNFDDAIINIFPGGSMTGAPKLIAMSILQDIENTPRDIYSGCIGFISLEENFIFNIVIRTAIIRNKTISIGAGGAITIKSDDEEEYNEMLLKFMSIAKPISSYLKEYHNTEVEYCFE